MDNTTNSTNGTADGSPFTAEPKSFWTNLLLPTLYLAIVIGSLYTFSSLYRKRQVSRAAKLEDWFPPHKQRDIYLSLLHLDPAENSDSEKKLSKIPDSILKAALLQRAIEDMQRIKKMRGAKPALQSLLQRGSIGDDLWKRFLRAEKEMEEEVKDVVNEANAFSPGWGQVIFQSANEMDLNRALRERVTEIQAQTAAEKEWWEKKRTGIQSDFMKELDASSKPAEAPTQRKAGSDEDAVLVEAGGPAQAQGGGKKKGKKK